MSRSWSVVVLAVMLGGCQCGPGGADGGSGGGSGGGASGAGGGGGSASADGGCPQYTARCGSACLPVSSDPMNCGGCGVACNVAGGQVCSAGQCVGASSCRAGLTACAGSCVDVQSDNRFCGNCTTACPAGQGCAAGTCVMSSTMGPGPSTCPPPGAPFGISTGSGTVCAGNLAQVTFRWAICTCEGIASSSPLVTHGIGGALDAGGAALGMNSSFNGSALVDVDGALWCGGNSFVTASPARVAQFMKNAGSLSVNGGGSVRGDAEVGGDIVGQGFSIGGTLTYPASKTLTGSVTAGSTVRANVAVPLPCDCSASQKVPVAAIVNARAGTANDNATIALNADVVANPPAARRLDLPCGHYFLSRIGSSFPVFIGVHGRAALYIDGDINASAPLSIVPDPGVELDIFMKGALTGSSSLRLGNPNEAANTRVYTAGNGNMNLSSSVTLGAFIYAPDSALVTSGELVTYGGLFVRNMNPSGAVTVNFDRAIVNAGSTCSGSDAGTPSGCGSCRDCNNQACVGGACGACTSDAQCCAPLICLQGSCVPVIN